MEHVLQARVLAVGPVAEVAVHGHDRHHDFDGMIGMDKAHDVCEPRKRRLLVVGDPHSAAGHHVEAFRGVRPCRTAR